MTDNCVFLVCYPNRIVKSKGERAPQKTPTTNSERCKAYRERLEIVYVNRGILKAKKEENKRYRKAFNDLKCIVTTVASHPLPEVIPRSLIDVGIVYAIALKLVHVSCSHNVRWPL